MNTLERGGKVNRFEIRRIPEDKVIELGESRFRFEQHLTKLFALTKRNDSPTNHDRLALAKPFDESRKKALSVLKHGESLAASIEGIPLEWKAEQNRFQHLTLEENTPINSAK
jgi:hypothetical protein